MIHIHVQGNGRLARCQKGIKRAAEKLFAAGMKKEPGIDGILVTVGLCIIALLLCVVMKDKLAGFIEDIVDALGQKASDILIGPGATT